MTDLTRRQFFAVNIAAAIAAYFPHGIVGSGLSLGSAECYTLLMIVRTLFPHDRAEDCCYSRAIASIAARCRVDRDTSELITASLAKLDHDAGGSFATAALQIRISALKKHAGQAFFELIYAEMLRTTYESDDLWAMVATDACQSNRKDNRT